MARVGPQDITPGRIVALPVQVTKGRAWLACFVDPDTPEADARDVLLPACGGDEDTVRLASGPRSHCPYCYEEISQRQTWFRCAGRTSPSGKRCAPEAGPGAAGPDWVRRRAAACLRRRRRKGAATCPECMVETTIRICPVCHSRLPVQFGRVGSA